jgi:uncharacterized membrane protein
MPSLDGYSLNEEIKKLRSDVFEELTSMREAFRELYHYLDNIEKKEKACQAKKSAAKSKTPKKDKSALTTKENMAKA